MRNELLQLQYRLTRERRRLIAAAIADSAVAGAIVFSIAAALMILVNWPIAIAGVFAAFAGYFFWRTPGTLGQLATSLDERHGLSDLFSTVWAVRDHDEPWAASLQSIAEARAAALPPSPWPGRWTIRRSACGLAMGVVALLLTQLINTNSAQAKTDGISTAATSGLSSEPQRIADSRQRPADTATSETRRPSEHETAANGQSASESTQSPAKDAGGDGQADSQQASSIRLTPSASPSDEHAHVAGGGQISTASGGKAAVPGVIGSNQQSREAIPSHSDSTQANSAGPNRPATPPPAGYRDLISDFFAR